MKETYSVITFDLISNSLKQAGNIFICCSGFKSIKERSCIGKGEDCRSRRHLWTAGSCSQFLFVEHTLMELHWSGFTCGSQTGCYSYVVDTVRLTWAGAIKHFRLLSLITCMIWKSMHHGKHLQVSSQHLVRAWKLFLLWGGISRLGCLWSDEAPVFWTEGWWPLLKVRDSATFLAIARGC